MSETFDMILRCAIHQDVDAPPSEYVPQSDLLTERNTDDNRWISHRAQQVLPDPPVTWLPNPATEVTS